MFGPKSFPQQLDRFDGPIDLWPALDPFVVAWNAGLHAGDSLLARGLANLRQLIAVGSIDVVVTADAARIEGTAQQFVHRHSHRLASNVPQRLIDGRNRGSHHRTGAIEGMNIHRLPDVFDLHRVRADQEIFEVVDASHHGAGFAFQRSFTPSDQALIRFEFEEHVRPVGVRSQRNTEHFHSGDFQSRLNTREGLQSRRTASLGGLRLKRAAAQIRFQSRPLLGSGHRDARGSESDEPPTQHDISPAPPHSL